MIQVDKDGATFSIEGFANRIHLNGHVALDTLPRSSKPRLTLAALSALVQAAVEENPGTLSNGRLVVKEGKHGANLCLTRGTSSVVASVGFNVSRAQLQARLSSNNVAGLEVEAIEGKNIGKIGGLMRALYAHGALKRPQVNVVERKDKTPAPLPEDKPLWMRISGITFRPSYAFAGR